MLCLNTFCCCCCMPVFHTLKPVDTLPYWQMSLQEESMTENENTAKEMQVFLRVITLGFMQQPSSDRTQKTFTKLSSSLYFLIHVTSRVPHKASRDVYAFFCFMKALPWRNSFFLLCDSFCFPCFVQNYEDRGRLLLLLLFSTGTNRCFFKTPVLKQACRQDQRM